LAQKLLVNVDEIDYRPDDEGCQILKNHPKFCQKFPQIEDSKKLFVLPLDVTSDDSIKETEKEVNKILKVKSNSCSPSPQYFDEKVKRQITNAYMWQANLSLHFQLWTQFLKCFI